jgi:hypothetical protein
VIGGAFPAIIKKRKFPEEDAMSDSKALFSAMMGAGLGLAVAGLPGTAIA